jgi:hypothetical protein
MDCQVGFWHAREGVCTLSVDTESTRVNCPLLTNDYGCVLKYDTKVNSFQNLRT